MALFWFFFHFSRSHDGELPHPVHQQHPHRPVEDRQHGQVRAGQVRGGGDCHAVSGQDPHTAGRQGADAEAVRRAAGRGRAVAAGARAGRAAAAAAVEALEGVHRLRLDVQAAGGDDDAGRQRLVQAGQRDVGRGRDHQGAGEQPGERAQQPARVGTVHGTAGLSAGRPRRQVRLQAASVVVSSGGRDKNKK